MKQYTVGKMIPWFRDVVIYLSGRKFSFCQRNEGHIVDCSVIASHYNDRHRPSESQSVLVKQAAIQRAKHLASKLGWCLLHVNNLHVVYYSPEETIESIKQLAYPTNLDNCIFRVSK